MALMVKMEMTLKKTRPYKLLHQMEDRRYKCFDAVLYLDHLKFKVVITWVQTKSHLIKKMVFQNAETTERSLADQSPVCLKLLRRIPCGQFIMVLSLIWSLTHSDFWTTSHWNNLGIKLNCCIRSYTLCFFHCFIIRRGYKLALPASSSFAWQCRFD